MPRKRTGFTIAELLIVVAIIAVLVGISIPIFHGQLNKAREATDLANERNVKSLVNSAMIESSIYLGSDIYAYDASSGTLQKLNSISEYTGSAYGNDYTATMEDDSLYSGKIHIGDKVNHKGKALFMLVNENGYLLIWRTVS